MKLPNITKTDYGAHLNIGVILLKLSLGCLILCGQLLRL